MNKPPIKRYYYLGLLTCISTLFFSTKTENYNVIIIDVTNALFKENTSALVKKIGLGALIGYALTHWKNPGDVCLDALNKMSTDPEQKPATQLTYKGRIMPRCVGEWLAGIISSEKLRSQVTAYLEKLDEINYFKSNREKEIVKKIIDLLLDPQQLPDLTSPINQMIQLTKQLKQNGYKLLALTNLAPDTYDIMKKHYMDLLELFDDIILSHHVNSIKPDKKIYKHLLTKHQLNPTQCIMIDGDKANVATANKMGITGIYFSNPSQVRSNLRKLGIN